MPLSANLSHTDNKVEFIQTEMVHIFAFLPVLLFIHLDFFLCDLLSFGDINRDGCLLYNVIELDHTSIVASVGLVRTYIPCCWQVHGGPIFFC